MCGKWAARGEALAVDISTRLDEILSRGRDAEARAVQKTAIHKVLMSTREPFLTFSEIEAALRGKGEGVDDDALRRSLMEMAADGIVAQLEQDRYFIASDFDANDASELRSG